MAGLTAALAVMTVAGSVSQAVTQRKAARGVERMGDYEQQMAEENARLAEEQAADALFRGKESASRHRRAVRQFAGSQRATFAASGVDVGVGTAAELLGETAYYGELDVAMIRHNAMREAWGYDVQAAEYRNRGQFAGIAARTQAASLRNQSWSSLLTGGAQIVGLYGNRFSGGRSSRLPDRSFFDDVMTRAGY